LKCKICIKSLKPIEEVIGCHSACLKKLFGSTKVSTQLSYPRAQFQQEVRKAVGRGRMSISGVQPKAQMALESKNGPLVVVDSDGEFILKPTPDGFPEAAINEHLSMQLARLAGFDIPECGLIGFEGSDELAYLVRRFDRFDRAKLHHEDMMQILDIGNQDTNAKYDAASYSTVLNKIKSITGLGVALEGFKRVVFNYYIGNDDYHLKNISLMHEPTTKMTPMYDCINTQFYSNKAHSPIALNLTDHDNVLPYFGTMGNGHYARADFLVLGESVGLASKVTEREMDNLIKLTPSFIQLVDNSALSKELRRGFIDTLHHRSQLMNRIL